MAPPYYLIFARKSFINRRWPVYVFNDDILKYLILALLTLTTGTGASGKICVTSPQK